MKKIVIMMSILMLLTSCVIYNGKYYSFFDPTSAHIFEYEEVKEMVKDIR